MTLLRRGCAASLLLWGDIIPVVTFTVFPQVKSLMFVLVGKCIQLASHFVKGNAWYAESSLVMQENSFTVYIG